MDNQLKNGNASAKIEGKERQNRPPIASSRNSQPVPNNLTDKTTKGKAANNKSIDELMDKRKKETFSVFTHVS